MLWMHPIPKHELQDAIDTLRESVVTEMTDPEDAEEIANIKEAFEEVLQTCCSFPHSRPGQTPRWPRI